MDYNAPQFGTWPAKLVIGISRRIRSSRAYSIEAVEKANAKAAEKRRRRVSGDRVAKPSDNGEVNELGERDYSVFSEASTLVGEHHVKDHTDMMHRLAHHDSFDSLVDLTTADLEKLRDPYFDSRNLALERRRTSLVHERMVAELPEEIWQRIVTFLDEIDAASLAVSTKILAGKVGRKPLELLNLPENRALRISFLLRTFDGGLPDHLLCFQCAAFHRRLTPAKESLKADYVANPVYACPLVRDSVLPRTRLTHLRELPYYFVQLALRNDAHGAKHGIACESLERQWKCRDSGWKHRTRYITHDGHLLVRIVSQCWAPPKLTATEERHLLYDREEYTPFFSVCHHWKDGDLTKICKCALSHVPRPPDPYISQLKRAPKISIAAARPNFIVTMCDFCRPVRRCPECPSEYLIEVQMCEDKNDPINTFKHAIVVTRWMDLGDGSSPYTSPEWAAIHGRDAGEEHAVYESFSQIGRRAVSGVFESRVSGCIPGQRMISLNPKMVKKGEEGNGWY